MYFAQVILSSIFFLGKEASKLGEFISQAVNGELLGWVFKLVGWKTFGFN